MLISGFTISSAELLRPPQPPQHNYAFNKFRPQAPLPEPTFIQRITNWFFPWGGVSSEEEYHLPAAPKIDQNQNQQQPSYQQFQPLPPQFHQVHHQQPIARRDPAHVRDTEPTTARTTQTPPVTKCSPCNKVPWIPMMPTYQLPLVKSGGQQQQVYFKHDFENANQYAQVPGGYKYGPPSSTQPPSTTPIKIQEASQYNQGHQYYGAPPIKNLPFQGYQYATQSPLLPRATTFRPNTNTIDTSVITFTTNRPKNNNRPSRFTAAGSVTNPEYIPPPNVLPLEGENMAFAPIPIPNLSPTPIPPLFDAKDFQVNPYTAQKTGFIKLVPLDPVAQVSNNVNVQVKPDNHLPEFEAIKENPNVEVISSNLVAEFTLTQEQPTRNNFPSRQSFGFNLDLGNNLDGNATIHSPIVVDGLETATDNVGAGSEREYHHDVRQFLDVSKNVDESNQVLALHENQNQEVDDYTTTEGNYIVKFEPSLQTAADLAEKSSKKNNKSEVLVKNRDRPTPVELLDSPIFHLTTKQWPTVATPAPPPFKPMEDFTKKLATLWTSPLPVSTSTEPTITPSYKLTTTSKLPPVKSTTLSFLAQLSGGAFSGITPPREPPKPIPSTKKPKQIQIVIPYETYHKPAPFMNKDEQHEIITYRPIRGHYVTHPTRATSSASSLTVGSPLVPTVTNEIRKPAVVDEKFNGHGYHNDQEYHDHAQESKIVESKVTVEPPQTTKYLTKILANNIRDLLKKEKSPKPPKIDIIKLQRNIDGWTEQSFSGKPSTIALTGHTKTIPRSFLSTTMRASTFMKLPTTTLSPRTTFDPDLMEETKRQYDNILYKKDENLLYVKRHDRFLDRDNEHVLINNNLTFNSVHGGVKVFAPKTTLTPKELWKRLHITVSPLTNEKIYVVTPQPRHQPGEETTTPIRPRFVVRPTVGGKNNSTRHCWAHKKF